MSRVQVSSHYPIKRTCSKYKIVPKYSFTNIFFIVKDINYGSFEGKKVIKWSDIAVRFIISEKLKFRKIDSL